jgi:hypothetical protein
MWFRYWIIGAGAEMEVLKSMDWVTTAITPVAEFSGNIKGSTLAAHVGCEREFVVGVKVPPLKENMET